MSTTVMKDSIVGDNWIYQTAQQVPIQYVVNEQGERTGDLLTGPVRLAWPELHSLKPATPNNQHPKYGSVLLFSPYADFTPLYEAYYEACAKNFPDKRNAADGQYYGLHSPFRGQVEKANLMGYTPGCTFIRATSQFKPPIVDAQGRPVVDPSKVYPGVWAICGINLYAMLVDKTQPAKKIGIGFGLQTVMLIGDDQIFAGAGADPSQMYSGIQNIAAPVIQPGQLQHLTGGTPAPGAPPGTAPMAPPPAGGTFAAPPAAHTPLMPPGPAAPAAYAMPGQPATDPRGAAPAGYASWAEYDQIMASL